MDKASGRQPRASAAEAKKRIRIRLTDRGAATDISARAAEIITTS